MCGIIHGMFVLALERSRNGCAAALLLGRPPCSGRVAAMEIAGTRRIEYRRPYIASAAVQCNAV